MVVLKCLLDVHCNSTVAQRSTGFPRGFAAPRSCDLGRCRQELYICSRDWCHYCVHFHRPASIWLDDQVFFGRLTPLRNQALTSPSQTQRGNREQHERSRAPSLLC